ncbi:thiamine pyrophosphate-requiring protein [Labedella phragmitis]|uniref:Thiamine pyrophosphate-requiring protein n=1 Tax=Labedella phragmitis TaxID=2498849 RepID=A0A3S4BJH8_9MICO|nr:thiamine pyrophosphate-requiring protein [Labedella phragmitis]RWZ51521.1 thiamine pyrophosphate-requiring protein [Labedella phragmitis]
MTSDATSTGEPEEDPRPRASRDSSGATVSDALVERLGAWGIDRVFGYSGDGINGVLAAIRRAGTIEFVQARHEENAAFMATGHAKYGGGVGVMLSTQGPGAIHLLNGLYDAKLDHVPVVAIIGQQHSSVLGSGYMQEVDLQVLFSDVAAQFLSLVSSPDQVPMVIDRAFRSALATRSPAVVIVPHDVQSSPAPQLPHEHGVIVTSPRFTPSRPRPEASELDAAAAILDAGERIAFLVGRGASGARDDVTALAERLGAGVTTSLLGKPFVDEHHELVAGTMGHLGTVASGHVLTECDTLVIVGSHDPWTEFYPAPGQARAIQIDTDARVIGDRYPVEVGLVGDAAETLQALIDRVGERIRPWTTTVREHVENGRRVSAERAAVPADPVNPEAVVRALDERLPADALVAIDVGSPVYWYARQLHLPRGVDAHLSGTLASMGCGVPYGLAAKLLTPERPIVVLAGDGGMQMTGLTELATIASRWPTWSDPRFVIAVFDNHDLAEVSWEQREMEGEPRFRASQALPSVPFADVANLLGLGGECVSTPEALDGAWERAFAADRPYVLDIRTDPAVPLIPPLSQAGEKLEGMRRSLEAERAAGGEHAERALRLLETYAGIELGT